MSDRTFFDYWAASSISNLGDGVSSVAIPLLAVSLGAGPTGMGFLSALLWVPSLLFSLHIGTWVDRFARHRATMVLADLLRCGLLASLPLAALLDVLTLGQVYVVVFCVGACSIFFTVSSTALFAVLVGRERYVAAQSLLGGSKEFAQLSGPALAGLLAGVIAVAQVILIDAASFIGSAALLRRAAPTAVAAQGSVSSRRSLADGLRYIARTPVIRAMLGTTGTINFFLLMIDGLFVLYMLRGLGVSTVTVGLVSSVEAAGGLLGAMVSGRLAARFGEGRAVLLGAGASFIPLLLLPVLGGPAAVVLIGLLLAVLVVGIGRAVNNVAFGSVFAATVPDGMRAQVRGAFQAVSFGLRPFGALVGGVLGALIGLRPTIGIAAIGGTLSVLIVLRSPALLGFRIDSAPAVSSPAAAG